MPGLAVCACWTHFADYHSQVGLVHRLCPLAAPIHFMSRPEPEYATSVPLQLVHLYIHTCQIRNVPSFNCVKTGVYIIPTNQSALGVITAQNPAPKSTITHRLQTLAGLASSPTYPLCSCVISEVSRRLERPPPKISRRRLSASLTLSA